MQHLHALIERHYECLVDLLAQYLGKERVAGAALALPAGKPLLRQGLGQQVGQIAAARPYLRYVARCRGSV